MCDCRVCPECQPEIAAAAELAGMEFLQVLTIIIDVQTRTLDRLIKLRATPVTRAERRRQARALSKIREKRDKARGVPLQEAV
ncbi:MAG: hypothetical protein QOG87_3564 [Actinomycetota bacterium]|jgi:hypothetical protein